MNRIFFLLAVILAGSQLSAQSNGPWNSPLMIAVSQDGTTFANQKIFQDSSGVPSLARISMSNLIAAFQWFPAPLHSRHWDSVAVKFSSDNGATWSKPKPIIVTGLPSNFQRPFDPSITVTLDGKFRMYFSSGLTGSSGLTASVDTYSALSLDGVNYMFEPNARFDQATRIVIDPSVLRFNGKWHFLAPKGAPQEGSYHASSDDGLIFSVQPDIPSDNQHNWTGNLMLEDLGQVRFYGSGPKIWWSSSTDLGVWSPYSTTNLQGGDPAAIKLDANSYLMIYVGPKQVITDLADTTTGQITVYPNPGSSQLHIAFNQGVNPVDIKLYDVYGTEVLSQNIDFPEQLIDIQHLPVGFYVAHLSYGLALVSWQKVLIVR